MTTSLPATAAPLATGANRMLWAQLPAWLRAEVEAAAGASVVAEHSQTGGFSPGLASLLRLADGRSVFLKAVCSARNPDSPRLYRREIGVLRALPATVPVPRLLWSYDNGDWVAFLTVAVDGSMPAQPWRSGDLDRFLAMAAGLAELLDPSPIQAEPVGTALARDFCSWRTLAGDRGADTAGLAAAAPWAAAHLDRLAEVESGWAPAATGTALLHADLRADNVLFTTDGVMVVDWPWACVGAGWVDLLLVLPSIAMHGGGDPELLWQRYRPGRAAEPEAVTAVLTAVTGFFVRHSLLPPPRNLPLLRPFQAAQGRAALAWLRHRIR